MEDELNELIEENTLLADDFEGKLDELLTLEMAAEISGYPANEAKKSPDTDIEKKYNKISITYSWDKTKRKRNLVVMGRTIEAPVSDMISLSWVENMTLEQFKQKNRNPTQEEIDNANKAIEEKMAETKQKVKATEEQMEVASSMAKNAMQNYSVEKVSGVGEFAVFVNQKFAGVPTRELKVYYKGISFTVSVDLSDNKAENDKKAIVTAKMIINQKLS